MKPSMKLKEFDLALGITNAEMQKVFEEEVKAKQKQHEQEVQKESTPPSRANKTQY